jgi:F-type H+-transporting ATPase subunit delta
VTEQSGIVARSYARALFDLAEKQGRLEAFGEGLREIARILDEVPSFRLFLETPRIDRDEKKRVLRETLGDKVPRPVLNFVLLTIDRRRQRFLRTMNREYQLMVDERFGRTHVEVSLARQPDGSTLEVLKARLSSILDRDVIPHIRIVPELLGGIVFRSGDTVYDGSVRRRLDQMRRQLLAADVSTD